MEVDDVNKASAEPVVRLNASRDLRIEGERLPQKTLHPRLACDERALSIGRRGEAALSSLDEYKSGNGTTAYSRERAAYTGSRLPYLPPCRVCCCPASGFHYGVNTCEACKGFFHRSLQRTVPYSCSKAGLCDVRLAGRNCCAACRYQRCIKVGMAKTGVKTGRYTHQKRTDDTLEIKRVLSILSVQDSSAVQYERIIVDLTTAFKECFYGTSLFYTHPGRLEALKKNVLLKHNTTSVDTFLVSCASPQQWSFHVEELAPRLTACLTEDTVGVSQTILGKLEASFSAEFGDISLRAMYERWNEEMEALIRSIVRFAKSIPGYSKLPLQDQIALIKAGRADLIFLIKYKHGDPALRCLMEVRDDRVDLTPFRYLRLFWQDKEYADLCRRYADRLHSYALSLSDIALLMAVSLLSPDREGLTAMSLVQAAQDALLPVLQRSVSVHHPHELSMHAKVLLVLPQLRELSERNRRVMADLQRRSPLGFVPLVTECLSQKSFECAALCN